MSFLRRIPAFAALLCCCSVVVNGIAKPIQEPDSKKDEAKKAEPAPTAEAVEVLAGKFQTERKAALAAKFPAEAMTRADEMAKRAEAALANNNPRAAARYYRDARWQLPYLPVNLPRHVARVFGESRMRHSGAVISVSYSPDGLRLASASADNTVKVWDLGNGRELVTYRGHADQPDDPSKNANVLKIGGVAFHPKDKMIASVGGNQVHLWDPDTGKLIKVLATIEKTDKPLKCLAFSPDGKSLAVGDEVGVLRVFEVGTGKNTFSGANRNARIERVAFSPNGKLIGVADSNGNAAVYAPGVGNGMPMSTGVLDQTGECLGIAFTADSGAIFTCGQDSKAKLFAGPKPDGTSAGNTATKLHEFIGHTGSVNDLAVPADAKILVTGGEDRTVRVWDATSGKQLRSFQVHMSHVRAVAVRRDGRQIASASDDGAIRLWDLSTSDDHRALTDAKEPIWTVAVSPDGKRAAAAGADKVIRVYDPETGRLEATLTGSNSAVTTLAFFPDSNRLASAGGDRIVRIWDVAAKKPIQEMTGHELPVLGIAVSADGKLVVSGAADGTARGWDPDTGKALWTWSGKSKAICGVAIRAGRKNAALATADGSLVVLDISSNNPKEISSTTAHVAGVAAVCYSPDGTKLASAGGDGAVRIWTISETGQPVPLAKFDGQAKPGTASGFSPLSAASFSADGRFVASAGADAVVRVWDIQTQAEVRGLRGHTDWATCVAFGPDGRILVSGGADKVVRIFELSPQEGAGGAGHLLAVNAVAVSPDGKWVATASLDHTVKIWELANGRELATLIFSSGEEPYAISFLGNSNVVMGSGVTSTGTGRLHFWQTQPPKLLTSLTVGEVYSVLGGGDGSKLGAWSARTVVGDRASKSSTYEIYDSAGKALVTFADKGNEVKAASFSADLRWVASGDEQGVVRLFDLDKKDRIGSDWPLFDKFPVGDLGLTPDKKLLVAIDRGGLLKVAEVAKRTVIAPAVTAHKGDIVALLVSPKGDAFITIGADREVKAWSLADPTMLKETRSWAMPVGVKGAAYTPDGKSLITANADGTAYVLELE
jgi:WD40 repeat protein